MLLNDRQRSCTILEASLWDMIHTSGAATRTRARKLSAELCELFFDQPSLFCFLSHLFQSFSNNRLLSGDSCLLLCHLFCMCNCLLLCGRLSLSSGFQCCLLQLYPQRVCLRLFVQPGLHFKLTGLLLRISLGLKLGVNPSLLCGLLKLESHGSCLCCLVLLRVKLHICGLRCCLLL